MAMEGDEPRKFDYSDFKEEINVATKATSMIPEWTKAGEDLVMPELQSEWKLDVSASAMNSFKNGRDIPESIEIMKALRDGMSIKNVAYMLKESPNVCPSDEMGIRLNVLKYMEQGPAFFEISAGNRELSSFEEQMLQRTRDRNAKIMVERARKLSMEANQEEQFG